MDKKEAEPIKTKKNKSFTRVLLITLVSFVISIPLAFYINRYVPVFYLFGVEVDLIFTFSVIFLLISATLDKYQKLSYFIFLLLLVYFTHRFIKNGVSDIKNMVKSYYIIPEKFSSSNNIKEASNEKSVVVSVPHVSFQDRVKSKIDFKDSVVRNFAVEKSLLYFDEYYPKYSFICREFSLIKYIKQNFKYVRDPRGFDYLAGPIETIHTMGGDCDDHSILLASTIKSIGGNVRLVLSPNHIYPELFCGDEAMFSVYLSAIRTLFYEESLDKVINFREDNGKFWLNIDYTDYYPGSYYMSDTIIAFINL